MKPRSPVVVLLLAIVTFGIYGLIWQIQTKDEMNRLYGAGIPTAWLLLLPVIGPLLWSWKWASGADQATGMSAGVVFLLMILLPVVGMPVMVSKFNAATPAGSLGQLRAA